MSQSNLDMSGDDPQRSYDGYLLFQGLSKEAVNSAITLGREYGIELNVTPTALEFQFIGRDTNRFIVQLLQRIAGIVRDADGEVQCQISGDADPSFEFYKIRTGRLFRQLAHVIRQPEEEVT